MSSCCGAPEPEEKASCCGSEPVKIQSSCCSEEVETQPSGGCCSTDTSKKSKPDYLLWTTLILVVIGYSADLIAHDSISGFISIASMAEAIRHFMDTMWIGLAIGIFFVGVLGRVPREFVTSLLGRGDSFVGIIRATLAGVLLDLCSHGILLVAMRLYQRGASLGQVMAFLIASPWNSLSLTIILMTLIGWQWTLLFIACSMAIGIVSGLIFNLLEKKGTLPPNPNTIEVVGFEPWKEAKLRIKATQFSLHWLTTMIWEGIKDSKMIVRWLLLGVLLAAVIRTFVPIDSFQTYFGATLAGLGMTLVVATILEICSEGSTPIAADLVTRAHAPVIVFAFLRPGVSTDYTDIISLRETTGSWKVALFLPLITLPQVILLSLIMNLASI